jgi:hypothetical protein
MHHHELLDELREPMKSLRRSIPDVWNGFISLHDAAMAEGVVPTSLKEVTALAISYGPRAYQAFMEFRAETTAAAR